MVIYNLMLVLVVLAIVVTCISIRIYLNYMRGGYDV